MEASVHNRFDKTLNFLRALVQGVRVSFADTEINQQLFQLNKPLMESLYRELEDVYKRTCQICKGREVDIPEVPLWSDSTISDLYSGVYSENDWEVFAATFRAEVETFLLAMTYCGYDFEPPVRSPDLDFDIDDDEELEEVQLVQKPLSPEVAKLLSDSMRYLGSQPGVINLSMDLPQTTPSSIPSVHWRDPPVEDTNNDLYLNGPLDDGRQGELIEASGFEVPNQFPTSNLPRGPAIAELSVDYLGPDRDQADPAVQDNFIPDYQTQQIERIYQAPPDNLDPVIPGTGMESFNNLFRPNPYAKNEVPSFPESAGIGRKADVTQDSSQPNLDRSNISFSNIGHSTEANIPTNTTHISTMGSNSFPTLLSRPKGLGYQRLQLPELGDKRDPPDNYNGHRGYQGPPGPPGGGFPPNYPQPSGGNGPPGPPDGNSGDNGNGNGRRQPMGNDRSFPNRRNMPSSAGGGGPPGPPDPSGGGAVDSNGKPRKEFVTSGLNKIIKTSETHFDTKLKPDIVPTWDGDDSTIIRWLTQIDEIALKSESVFKGLGDIVPTRFRDNAASWWYSLPASHRHLVSTDWDSLKREIRTYWMNQTWIEKAQIRANNARYREPSHSNETPTQYVIRKLELLKYVYNYTPSQTMAQILHKAPPVWSTVVNPRHYSDLASFQTAIKYHEELLMNLSGSKYYSPSPRQSRSYKVDVKSRPNQTRKPEFKKKSVRTYAVGWDNPKRTYPHPRDDATVSKGKTPADYNARGCLLCGSTNHWDRDCKYNKGDAVRKARVMFVDCLPDDMHAEAEYECCYMQSQELAGESEEETSSDDEIEETYDKSSEAQNEEEQGF